MNISRTERDGILLILASVTAYAMLPVFIKALQLAGLSPLDIATWRFGLAAPLAWLIVRGFRLPVGDKSLPRLKLVGMGTLLAAAAVITFYGFERLPVGTFVVLFYTYPAIIAVLCAFMGERLPLAGWVALVLTTIGIVLTVPDFGQGVGNDSIIGVLMAMVCAVLVAVYFLLNSRVLKEHTAFGHASAWTTTGALLVLLLLIPFRAVQQPGHLLSNMGNIAMSLPVLAAARPDGAELLLRMLAIAGFSTVLAGFLLMVGIQKVGAPRASIIGTVEPILTLIFARLFLGEQMQTVQLVGGAFIIASVIVLQLGSRVKVPAVE
ncbi:MAG: DMT family transporter [Chloroflexi bacterium]|nr:DMT family transporter [Chloroflexota bacterium]MCC6894720.1 DMT family transporter [Anaerolineae bacterium]